MTSFSGSESWLMNAIVSSRAWAWQGAPIWRELSFFSFFIIGSEHRAIKLSSPDAYARTPAFLMLSNKGNALCTSTCIPLRNFPSEASSRLTARRVGSCALFTVCGTIMISTVFEKYSTEPWAASSFSIELVLTLWCKVKCNFRLDQLIGSPTHKPHLNWKENCVIVIFFKRSMPYRWSLITYTFFIHI